MPGLPLLVVSAQNSNAFKAGLFSRWAERIRSTLYAVLLFLAYFLSGTPAKAQMEIRPFAHNSYDRPYLVYRPPQAAPHPPVVFMLGGITSTAQSSSVEYGWTEEADKYGFLAVFPNPVRTDLNQPKAEKNITFWEMQGSRTHILKPGAPPLDDDGYLRAVINDVVRRDHPDRNRIFFAGFSSGSGMAQLFASRHPDLVDGVVAVATPLMEPPEKLARPVPILYIHGDEDEQFTAFETNSTHFATTPHGNWVTWGYLDGCRKQTAEKTEWGVQLRWQGCRRDVAVIADFVKGVGHEWKGSISAKASQKHTSPVQLDFTEIAWHFFASIGDR
jgi:polyhydroxybutyrate depolymerase